MNIEYWKTLPTNTQLILQIVTDDENKMVKCAYSHMWYDSEDNDGCIYCFEYDEETNQYRNHPDQFIDFCDDEFTYCGDECTDINIFHENKTRDDQIVYVPIDKKYLDHIKKNFKILKLGHDYEDQGWCADFTDFNESEFHVCNNQVSFTHGAEGLWIEQNELKN